LVEALYSSFVWAAIESRRNVVINIDGLFSGNVLSTLIPSVPSSLERSLARAITSFISVSNDRGSTASIINSRFTNVANASTVRMALYVSMWRRGKGQRLSNCYNDCVGVRQVGCWVAASERQSVRLTVGVVGNGWSESNTNRNSRVDSV